jgi:phage terminase large subunit
MQNEENGNEIDLDSKFGSGYDGFRETDKRYRVLIGGRASKKSVNTAIDFIVKIMEYEEANLLCIRKRFNTHRDSTYASLLWAINYLGVSKFWKASVNPFQITYLPTGQKILFKGMDEPDSITSIRVEKGYLCWVWIEEAFQIENEIDFAKIDGSIRGKLPDGYVNQITLTFNPWSDRSWIKRRFFDRGDETPESVSKGLGWEEKIYKDVYTLKTTYLCNEFLSDKDRERFEQMKESNPNLYWIEGLGNWGIQEGLIYENWEESAFDFREILSKRKNVRLCFGLDFAYSNTAATALIASVIDLAKMEIFIFDEIYEFNIRIPELAKLIIEKGYQNQKIVCDRDKRLIDDLKYYGIRNVKKALKGNDTILPGIEFLKRFKVFVHPRCEKVKFELRNYAWVVNESSGNSRPADKYNDLMDAWRYSVEEYQRHSGVQLFGESRNRNYRYGT